MRTSQPIIAKKH